MSLAESIKEVNRQLEKVSIRVKSGRLYIRSTHFPPRPGENSPPKQIEIPAGYNASPAGLKAAKFKAQEIDAQLVFGKFDWTPYLRGKRKPAQTAGEWIDRYEQYHWEHTSRTATKEQTFKECYRFYFGKLPAAEPLTLELLRNTITTRSEPGSRSREFYCMAFGRLAEFVSKQGAIAESDLVLFKADLRVLKQGYEPEKILPENLPSDEQIVAIWESIKNPAWQWIYGMMATYGLRPSETFWLDLERFTKGTDVLRILKQTKTGARLTYPCRPEWRSLFKLWEVCYPSIQTEGKSNGELGKKISQEFRELKIPHNPYALRHAWCIRLALSGVQDSIAAKWAGHSITVHEKTYLQAISEAQHHQMFEQMRRSSQSVVGLAES